MMTRWDARSMPFQGATLYPPSKLKKKKHSADVFFYFSMCFGKDKKRKAVLGGRKSTWLKAVSLTKEGYQHPLWHHIGLIYAIRFFRARYLRGGASAGTRESSFPLFAELIWRPDTHFLPLFGGFKLSSELQTQKSHIWKANKAAERELYICGRKILQLVFFLPAADLVPD